MRGTPLIVEDSDQVVPTTSRKVFVALDEEGNRIGETHHHAKLSDAQVDQIRDLHEHQRHSYGQLAVQFAVSKATIQCICNYTRRASTIARWKVLLLHTPISITTKEE